MDLGRTLLDGALSFLLFAGAPGVDWRELREQRWAVLLLATVGVLFSTLLVAGMARLVFGWLGLRVPFLACLLFGALISPTDPIAVFGLLKQAKAPASLSTKIAGESLFNDGVGVVIFLVFYDLWTAQGPAGGELDWPHVGALLLREAGGGLVLGLLLGWVTYRLLRAWMTTRSRSCSPWRWSAAATRRPRCCTPAGPLAIVVAGIVIGNPGRAFAMSEQTRQPLDTFWELVDVILNALLFVLLGLQVLVLRFQPGYLAAAALAIPLVLLARLASVTGAGALLRLARRRAEWYKVVLLTWGGLRGAISIALALALPPGSERDLLLAATHGVVAFSILVQGLTMPWLLRRVLPAGETGQGWMGDVVGCLWPSLFSPSLGLSVFCSSVRVRTSTRAATRASPATSRSPARNRAHKAVAERRGAEPLFLRVMSEVLPRAPCPSPSVRTSGWPCGERGRNDGSNPFSLAVVPRGRWFAQPPRPGLRPPPRRLGSALCPCPSFVPPRCRPPTQPFRSPRRTTKPAATAGSHPPPPPANTAPRAAGVVGLAVMCSRVLGLARDQIFAALFGAGAGTDAFLTAFRAPNLLRDLFAEGALSTAFVTTFAKKIQLEGDDSAWTLANKVATLTMVGISALTLLGIALSPQLIEVLGGGFHAVPGKFELTVQLTRIMYPFILLVSLAALVMGMLNARHVFGAPAMASSFFNLGSIVGGVGLGYVMDPHFGPGSLFGLASGTLIGGFLQLVVQFPALRRAGYRFRPDFAWRDPGVRAIGRLMVPR